jgi:hypothetical protein
MQDMLDAAVSAGVSEVSVQYRIKADAQHLSTAAERSAYILGMRAAFLTIAKPTFTSRPSSSSSSPQPASPDKTQLLHAQPTLLHLSRQQAPLTNVAMSTEDETSLPSSPLPSHELLGQLLPETAPPLAGKDRYASSRLLLLCAYEACHGTGCPLQKHVKGLISAALRERRTVELFWKLVGERPGAPRHVANAEGLYTEAQFVHKRTRGSGAQLSGTSQPLRRWLMEPPHAVTVALASRPSSPHAMSAARSLSAVRSGSGGGGSSVGSSSGGKAGLTVSRGGVSPHCGSPGSISPSAAGGRAAGGGGACACAASSMRPAARTPGFNSSSARPLQPTAEEEAAQTDLWRAKRLI